MPRFLIPSHPFPLLAHSRSGRGNAGSTPRRGAPARPRARARQVGRDVRPSRAPKPRSARPRRRAPRPRCIHGQHAPRPAPRREEQRQRDRLQERREGRLRGRRLLRHRAAIEVRDKQEAARSRLPRSLFFFSFPRSLGFSRWSVPYLRKPEPERRGASASTVNNSN